MAFLTPLDLAAAERVGRHYGLTVSRIEPLAAGSVNSNFRLTTADGRWYFARIYEEQDASGAVFEARLLRELARSGVPTTEPLRALGEDVPFAHQGKPVAVYPWIAGRDLCLGSVDTGVCEKLGVALAGVHSASARVEPIPSGRFGLAGIESRLQSVERSTSALAAEVALLRGALSRYAVRRDAELPSGLVHGDLFRDNVLWQDGEISGLLDFESAARGAFIYDLAVCVLAWCFTTRFELENARALVRGYTRVRPLEAGEVAAFPTEAALACVRFATTRITDFELRASPGNPPGRDFRRFLERLSQIEAGALAGLFD